MDDAVIAYDRLKRKTCDKEANVDFDNLTEEQKARALACQTPEEIFALAQEEGYELTDEQLEGVAGGWGEANCGNYTVEPCNYTAPHPC